MQRPQVDDHLQNIAEDPEVAAYADPVAIAAVVTVLISAAESFAEVVVVLVLFYIEAGVTVIGVLVRIRALIIEAPAVQPVGLAGLKTLVVAIVHSVLENLRGVAIHLVIPPATRIAKARSGVEIRIAVVIVRILKGELLLAKALEILLLKAVLRRTLLLLEALRALLEDVLLLLQVLVVLRSP